MGNSGMQVQKDDLASASMMRLCMVVLTTAGVFFAFIGNASAATLTPSAATLTLKEAAEAAQVYDPWLAENVLMQEATKARSIAAGYLPDPQISAGLLNLPIDTFDLDQEPMTQVQVGIRQMIPRGESLELKREQLQTMSLRFPYERQERRATTVVTVGQLWYDLYKVQESIRLIEKDRPLFQQLGDVAEASYATAFGRTRQQDIIRAQLELIRLDDRVTALQQRREMLAQRLAEWISDAFAEKYRRPEAETAPVIRAGLQLPQEMPQLAMLQRQLYLADREIDPQVLYEHFADHPAVLAVEQRIKASELGVDIARQGDKPLWGLGASYGYRDDPSSGDRPDFVSVGVTFEMPLFTKNRQDKEVEAAFYDAAAVKTTKWSLIRKMIAGFENNKAQLQRLNQRLQLYEEQLLPQMHEQSEASLTAYTNDMGDFAEVVRARIAELNTRIDALDIAVERQKIIMTLNYYFMEEAGDIIRDA